MRPYLVVPDPVLSEEKLDNLYNFFSAYFLAPDHSLLAGNAGPAFSVLVTSVRDLYNAYVLQLKSDCITIQQQLQSAISERDGKDHQLQSTLSELAANRHQLRSAITERDAKDLQLKLTLAELTANQHGLQSALTERDGKDNQLQTALVELRANQHGLQSALTERDGKDNQLQTALVELRASEHQLHSALTERDAKEHQLQSTLSELRANQQELQSAFSEQARKEQEFQAALSEVAKQQRLHSPLSKAIKQLESAFSQATKEKSRAENALDVKRAAIKRLKQKLATENTTKRETEASMNEKNKELNIMTTAYENTAKMLDRFLTTGISRQHGTSEDNMCGSVSRSALWQKQQNVDGNTFHVDLNLLPLHDHLDPVAVQTKCDDLLSVTYPKEPPMYQPFTAFLADYLSDTEFLVLNTHKQYYLGGFAPDITVSLPGVATADAMSMVLFVELKAQDGTPLGSDHNLGQVYEYLLAAARCQQERTKFASILSNFEGNIAVVLTRMDKHVYLTHYISAHMPAVLQFITFILGDDNFKPPELGFSSPIGPMLGRLGQPSNSIVGEFALREWFPIDAGVTQVSIPAGLTESALSYRPRMAVKRSKRMNSGALDQEVAALLAIRNYGYHRNLPYIVHLSDDRSEIGMLPIGLPISSSTLSVPGLGSKIVSGVLSALVYLHSHGIIHRDVRRANVVLHGSTAVLIDFDAAAPAGRLTNHLGGCICIPEEVLYNPGEPYIPLAAHDYLALVIMVNSLLFPGAYRGFKSMNVCEEHSVERDRLIDLWKGLKESPSWGPLVAFAAGGKVEELCRGLQGLLVSL